MSCEKSSVTKNRWIKEFLLLEFHFKRMYKGILSKS